jgi:hypothetical protein
MKRLIDGLIFGTGFGLAFMTIAYLAASFFIVPAMIAPQRYEVSHGGSGAETYDIPEIMSGDETRELPFHELPIEDQINYASAIALAEFQPGPDGRMRAIITDILKQEKDVVLYYHVGDEYADSSYYPQESVSHGEGLIIFLTGSPAEIKMSMTYSGERIRGLGDMPLKLFREKCESLGT